MILCTVTALDLFIGGEYLEHNLWSSKINTAERDDDNRGWISLLRPDRLVLTDRKGRIAGESGYITNNIPNRIESFSSSSLILKNLYDSEFNSDKYYELYLRSTSSFYAGLRPTRMRAIYSIPENHVNSAPQSVHFYLRQQTEGGLETVNNNDYQFDLNAGYVECNITGYSENYPQLTTDTLRIEFSFGDSIG